MSDESENRAVIFVTPMQLVLIRNIHLRVSSHYQRVSVCVCAWLILSCLGLSVPEEGVMLWLGQMEIKVATITACDIKTF